jgi:hypothetical protein
MAFNCGYTFFTPMAVSDVLQYCARQTVYTTLLTPCLPFIRDQFLMHPHYLSDSSPVTSIQCIESPLDRGGGATGSQMLHKLRALQRKY